MACGYWPYSTPLFDLPTEVSEPILLILSDNIPEQVGLLRQIRDRLPNQPPE